MKPEKKASLIFHRITFLAKPRIKIYKNFHRTFCDLLPACSLPHSGSVERRERWYTQRNHRIIHICGEARSVISLFRQGYVIYRFCFRITTPCTKLVALPNSSWSFLNFMNESASEASIPGLKNGREEIERNR